jgi:hypothetical protein
MIGCMRVISAWIIPEFGMMKVTEYCVVGLGCRVVEEGEHNKVRLGHEIYTREF